MFLILLVAFGFPASLAPPDTLTRLPEKSQAEKKTVPDESWFEIQLCGSLKSSPGEGNRAIRKFELNFNSEYDDCRNLSGSVMQSEFRVKFRNGWLYEDQKTYYYEDRIQIRMSNLNHPVPSVDAVLGGYLDSKVLNHRITLRDSDMNIRNYSYTGLFSPGTLELYYGLDWNPVSALSLHVLPVTLKVNHDFWLSTVAGSPYTRSEWEYLYGFSYYLNLEGAILKKIEYRVRSHCFFNGNINETIEFQLNTRLSYALTKRLNFTLNLDTQYSPGYVSGLVVISDFGLSWASGSR